MAKFSLLGLRGKDFRAKRRSSASRHLIEVLTHSFADACAMPEIAGLDQNFS
jgi:hypothetical protein